MLMLIRKGTGSGSEITAVNIILSQEWALWIGERWRKVIAEPARTSQLNFLQIGILGNSKYLKGGSIEFLC
jgi:hypothetical protein